jgi:hypothetical protein
MENVNQLVQMLEMLIVSAEAKIQFVILAYFQIYLIFVSAPLKINLVPFSKNSSTG